MTSNPRTAYRNFYVISIVSVFKSYLKTTIIIFYCRVFIVRRKENSLTHTNNYPI